jgi:uncharacterized protein (TIRG00374 family)
LPYRKKALEKINIKDEPDTQKSKGFSGLLVGIGKRVLLLVVLGLAIQLILPQITSFQNNLAIVKSLKTWLLGLAVLAQFFGYVGNGFTIKELVKSAHRQFSVMRGVMISLASASIGMVAGGMIASAASIFRWVKASGGGNGGASLSATLPPIILDVVLLGISIIGGIYLFFNKNITEWQVTAFASISLLLLALFVFFSYALKNREKSKMIAYKFVSSGLRLFKKKVNQERINQEFDRLFNAWDSLLAGGWKGPFLGSIAYVFFDMLTIYLVFLSTGNTVPIFVLIAGYGLPVLLGKMAFIFPGGIGIIETSMVALYASLGVPSAQATVVVLVYRIISFWVPLILGFMFIPFLSNNNGKNKQKA